MFRLKSKAINSFCKENTILKEYFKINKPCKTRMEYILKEFLSLIKN